MKKSLYILSFCALLLSACTRMEDYTTLGSVDKRVSAKLNEYQTILCEAPNGWIADIQTGTGGTHRLWMNFNDKNEVIMYTDYVEYYRAFKTSPNTSTYKLKAQQLPTLSFDTYSYLSIFADPNPLINGSGKPGVGMLADFEYDIISYKKGQFQLSGNKHGMQATLTQATAEEMEKVAQGALMDCVTTAPTFEPQFYTFYYKGQSYELSSNGRKTALCWMSQLQPVSIIQGSQNDFEGNIILAEPMLLDDQPITRFNKTATGYTVNIGNELIEIRKTTATPASYLGYRNTDLSNVLYMFTSAQTEWNSEFYEIMQTLMSGLYNDQKTPVYVPYISVQVYTNPVAWIEVGYYMMQNGRVDQSRVYSVIYVYPLKANADGSYTFGDTYTNYYGDTDVMSNHIKPYAKGLLDGFFKGRTFYFKAWPKELEGGKHPYVALVPTEGMERTGAMVGYAFISQ